MENISVILLLLTVVTALAQVTDKVKIPYPILLVLAGIAIGFAPWFSTISLNPEIVFLIFLPPVLYAAAWSTSWFDFKASARPISLLAVGCVLFTTVGVAAVAHYLIPGMGWPEAFVLGAIVSPPDAVAATSATKGLNLPKRLITILEGESLVNDATALIAYRYAIAATATGTFIFWLATIDFFYVAGVGILMGTLIGFIFYWIHKITPDNATTDTTFTLLTPYVAYLAAEAIHASGVLSVVTAGLILTWTSSEIFDNRTRLQAYAVWDTMIFLLNGVIFIMIGLQLPTILKNIGEQSLGTLIGYGAVISVATIVLRIMWVFPGAYIPRWLSKRIRTNEPDTNIKRVSIIAWSGMRGIVSLAAALALPLTLGENIPFPNRDLIIFLTFCVIFSTLVVQGLTLRPLVKWFKVKEGENHQEKHARVKLAASAIEHIEENFSLTLSDVVLNQIKKKYEIRIQRLQRYPEHNELTEEQIAEFLKVQHNLIAHERKLIIEMRNNGIVDDEVLKKIEHELDLEETRLMMERENY